MTKFDFDDTTDNEAAARRQRQKFFLFLLIISICNLLVSGVFLNPLFIVIFAVQLAMIVFVKNQCNASDATQTAQRVAQTDVVVSIILAFGLVVANLMQPKYVTHAEFLILGLLSFLRLFSSILFARSV